MPLVKKFGMLILFTIHLTLVVANTGSLQSRKNLDCVTEYYQRLMAGGSSKLSELNMFITAMPKGGDVHHHYSGSIYVETYLDWLAKHNYCVYRTDNVSMNIQKYRIETRLHSSLSDELRVICMTADQTRSDIGFYRELLKHWSNIDYVNHYHEQLSPDQQFFNTFGKGEKADSRDSESRIIYWEFREYNRNSENTMGIREYDGNRRNTIKIYYAKLS